MTFWPINGYDDDSSIPRIDNNISELGDLTINALRDAVFAIEAALGLTPSGSLSSLSDFLNVSFNYNGTIKASALTSVGLATLPIVDNQVAFNAAIKESKLDLDYSTSSLHTQIVANVALTNVLATFTATINSDLLIHILGGQTLSDGSTSARHVASHIDLNAVPSDPRDPLYNWTGLKDKDGNTRAATQVAAALLEVNDALTDHENLIDNAHPATAITVDPSNFTELSQDANTVQKALDEIDDAETLRIGVHRQEMHSNGVPKKAHSTQIDLDGYNNLIVPATKIQAFLVKPPATMPVDNINYGDDIIKFIPTNTNYLFDSQFTNVKPGDHIHVNYGNGLEAIYLVDSARYQPGSEWFVRINGYNLFNTDGYDAYASIYRPFYDTNTYGVLAVASANNDIDTGLYSSLIVGHPKGATALGLNFDANQLDSTHYNLWLQFYPSGNPTEKIIDLPAIDVTGNAGTTPGQYSIDRIVHETNNALRAGGFNYRFIAFNHEGEFGIMLADPVGKASFAIINGTISGSSLAAGTYTNNVIDDITDAKLDALGFGANKSKLASPNYTGSFSSASLAANFPTRIITPLKSRHYIADGVRSDVFAPTYLATTDGYWPAQLTARTPIGVSTVEVTYTVNMCLQEAKLKPGKTIVVQPAVEYSDPLYQDVDYGRFIIKDVSFTAACGDISATTVITVINGLHATGSPAGFSSSPVLDVRLYFGEDSVAVNDLNVVGFDSVREFNRLFEVYITGEGETFAHERARMFKQIETSILLGTDEYWDVKYVSPKLRGYVDDSATNFRKFIRFYVLNYNVTSGEFDGYIGKRDDVTADIYNVGPLTTARKNVPAKFYDETGIDYIELEFNDFITAGNSVMSTNSPRYVDIEIFQSLQLDKEVFLLATCEVDDKIIEAVVDRRDFGNTSEDDFTTSALNYISAADQALHSNGVIRGLSYAGIDPTDQSLIVFNGGSAIVNGKVVSVNNGKARIPQIREFGSPTPATVYWAVCVNESGQFEPIIITTTKTQYYATTNGITNYYVPSVTFVELVSTRKDLTVIAIATATISSIALSVVDARKFVANEAANIPLTWVPTQEPGNLNEGVLIGHFNTFEALKSWVNNYGGVNNVIKVRGTFNIDTYTDVIDLTGFNNPVTFEGENATFNVAHNFGLLLGSDITIRGITFNYTPTIIYTGGDVINIGNGCLYTSGSYSNILIENCNFATGISGQSPPMISFHATEEQVFWRNIIIQNNIFSSHTATLSDSQPAIAFLNENTTANPTILDGVKILNNRCWSSQGIYITSTLSGEGIVTSNCEISGNNCGVIGYLVSGSYSGFSYINNDLTISNNTCQFIANVDLEGDFVLSVFPDYGRGFVKILNNRCSWIHVGCAEGDNTGGLLLSGNNLTSRSTTFASTHHGTFTGNTAILVSGTAGASVAKIIDNTICNGPDGYYNAGGMSVISSASVISGNSISGVSGHTVDIISVASNGVPTTITNNQILRGEEIINSYINCNSSTGQGLVVDNILDGYTVNNVANTNVIINASNSWIVERNKNQTRTISIRPRDGGVFMYRDGGGATGFLQPQTADMIYAGSHVRFTDWDNNTAATGAFQIRVNGSASPASAGFDYELFLSKFLPRDVSIISCSIQYQVINTANWSGSSNIRLRLMQKTYGGTTSDTVTLGTDSQADISASASGTLTVTATTPTIISDTCYVTVGTNTAITTTSPSEDLGLSAISVTYRW